MDRAPLGLGLGVLLGLGAGLWGWCVALGWSTGRAWRRGQRQWAVQQQLWDLERQMREEAYSDEGRAMLHEACARQRAITQEARRRLGLAEEEA